MNRLTSCCFILLAMAGSVAAAETNGATFGEASMETNGPSIAVEEEALATPGQELPRPETFDGWGDRIDYIHQNFHYHVQHTVDRVDTYFAKDGTPTKEVPPSKLRLGMYMELEVDSGVSFALDPDYDLEVQLPNLESRWNIIVTGKDVSDLPGTDPTERDGGVNVGIQKNLGKYHVQTGAGVKVKWLPEAFAEVKWIPIWSAGAWRFHPQIKGYFETDDGFGSLNSFIFYRWFGKRERGMVRSTSAGRWTEDTQGVEWEQTFVLGYVPQLLQRKHRNRSISAHDTARAIGIRTSAFGHKDSAAVVDRYRLTFAFRFPLYRNFIYGEIMPELDWKNENDWDPIQKIRLGVDVLFWGIADRP